MVKRPSEFGIRAVPPSHPELLDWLATQFVSEGWSTRKLHRLILLSNTYRQRSDGPDDHDLREREIKADPENRYLWRMNPRRLTFEEFRDTLLSVTGRLDPVMGGRASDLFAGDGITNRRRTLYGLVDRQFLPPVMRVFDFANPDLHIPQRSETTVPQQALFGLNHPLMAESSRSLSRLSGGDDRDRVRNMYRAVYQRFPTTTQLDDALAFLAEAQAEQIPAPRPESFAWQYGYGEFLVTTGKLKEFTPLPYFSGTAWQGGPQYPDPVLGWLQLTARGGHTGNDLKHSIVRRWTAPHDGNYSIVSTVRHEVDQGDGIRCWIVSGSQGLLASASVHNREQLLNIPSVSLKAGETLDFIADLNENLNSEQHLWALVISTVNDVVTTQGESALPEIWDAERDFTGPQVSYLNRWDQLAQVLLLSNELMFVD